MAIRFTSYDIYKQLLANEATGEVSGQATFFGKGVGSIKSFVANSAAYSRFSSGCH